MFEKTLFVEGGINGGGVQVDAPSWWTLQNSGRSGEASISSSAYPIGPGGEPARSGGTPDLSVEQIEAFCRAIRPGEVYRIQGYAKEFNGTCEVNVNDGIANLADPIRGGDLLDPSWFVHAPADDDGVRRGGLGRMTARIEDPGVFSLVSRVMNDTPGFFEVPAAKRRHHDYMGGALRSTPSRPRRLRRTSQARSREQRWIPTFSSPGHSSTTSAKRPASASGFLVRRAPPRLHPRRAHGDRGPRR